jgi:hypothetical protein
LHSGDHKRAASRLKSTAERLRREASTILVTDERTAESLNIITAEANEMEILATSAQFDDISYSSKRLSENYSEKTRARKMRTREPNPKTQSDYDS